MKIEEISEDAVNSSWISEIHYHEENKIVTMLTSLGNQYEVHDVPENVYNEWLSSPSKGRYYNTKVRNNYEVTRTK